MQNTDIQKTYKQTHDVNKHTNTTHEKHIQPVRTKRQTETTQTTT